MTVTIHHAHAWTPSRRHLIAMAGTVLATPWIGANAQGKIAGGKPITLVVSYPPGGGADLMARTIAPKLEAALGQTVVVEKRPAPAANWQQATWRALRPTAAFCCWTLLLLP